MSVTKKYCPKSCTIWFDIVTPYDLFDFLRLLESMSLLRDWKGTSSSLLEIDTPREGYGMSFLVGIESSTSESVALDLVVRNDSKGSNDENRVREKQDSIKRY